MLMLSAGIFVVQLFEILALADTVGNIVKLIKLFLLLVVGERGGVALGIGRSKVFGNYVGDTVVFVHVFFNIGFGNGISAVFAVNGGEKLTAEVSGVADIVLVRVATYSVSFVKNAVTVGFPVIGNVGVDSADILVVKLSAVFFGQNFGGDVFVNKLFGVIFNVIAEFNVALLGGDG